MLCNILCCIAQSSSWNEIKKKKPWFVIHLELIPQPPSPWLSQPGIPCCFPDPMPLLMMLLLPLARLFSAPLVWNTDHHLGLREIHPPPPGCFWPQPPQHLHGWDCLSVPCAWLISQHMFHILFRDTISSASLVGECSKVCHHTLTFVSSTVPALHLPWNKLLLAE